MSTAASVAPRPAARRSGARSWAVIAGLLILAVVAGAALFLHLGVPGTGGTWGTPSNVRAALTARGLECGRSVVLEPSTTMCGVEQGTRFLSVGVTTDGHLDYVMGSSAHLDPNDSSSLATFAKPYFAAVLGAVADGAHRGSAQSWLDASSGGTGHASLRSLDGHTLTLNLATDPSTGDAVLTVVLDDLQTGGVTPVRTTALPAITTGHAISHFTGLGLTCSTDPPYCDATTPDTYIEGAVDPNTDSNAVVPPDRHLEYSVIDCNHADVGNPPGNLAGIADGPMERNLPGVLGLVFTSQADQRRIMAWLTPRLASWSQSSGYRLAVSGIAVTVNAFAGNANGRAGFGWTVSVDPIPFDGIVLQG